MQEIVVGVRKMKQSWVIGIVMAYMMILGIEMLITGATSTSATGVGSEINNYSIPQDVDTHTSPNTGQSSVEINVGTVATSLWNVGRMAMLYFPAIFENGNALYQWFYWDFCFPIAVSWWIIVFVLFRGVSSS